MTDHVSLAFYAVYIILCILYQLPQNSPSFISSTSTIQSGASNGEQGTRTEEPPEIHNSIIDSLLVEV